MPKHLLLLILLLNIKCVEKSTINKNTESNKTFKHIDTPLEIENARINKKLADDIERLKQLDKYLEQGPVEISYVSHGCFHFTMFNMRLNKKSKNYRLVLSRSPKAQGAIHDYDELIKKVRYYNTYTLTPDKLKKLSSALIPTSKRSTTANYWTVKTTTDTLDFHDGSGGHGIGEFIANMIQHR